LYLIPIKTTALLSAAKLAFFLTQKNTLCLVHNSENKTETPSCSSSGEGCQQPSNSAQQSWYSEAKIDDCDDALSTVLEAAPGKNGKLHTIIVAATVLNFELLEEIINALPSQSNIIKIRANDYHCTFDKMVVNIDCEIDPTLTQGDTLNALNVMLTELSERLFIDVFVKPPISIAKPGLVVFDMDSTLIGMECIDEIAKLAGVGEAVSAVTERAMLGEIAFAESLHHRVACLEGVELNALLSIRKRLPFMPGFTSLMNELQRNGWKIAIASGGFTYFADYIKALFDFDYAFSNTLEVKDNKLTGKVVGKVVDAQAKADILQQLANDNAIPIENTVAVGDGANDLVMMSVAGTGIAFKAKPKVQAQATYSIRFSGLEAVLYLLG
jgi:phosphoserine phosphatase